MTRLRGLGVMVAAAALLSVGAPDRAEAQDGYNSGGSTAPDGMWFAGGINASASFDDEPFDDGPDGAGIRLEFGIPLTLLGPGQLSIVLPLSTVHESFPGGRFNSLTFIPEVQWEYVFPIRMSHRFSMAPQAGFGFGGVWAEDGPGAFMVSPKTGVVLRFGFDFGLLLEMQPLGFTFNVPFDDRFDFYAAYEWYAAVGYRWD